MYRKGFVLQEVFSLLPAQQKLLAKSQWRSRKCYHCRKQEYDSAEDVRKSIMLKDLSNIWCIMKASMKSNDLDNVVSLLSKKNGSVVDVPVDKNNAEHLLMTANRGDITRIGLPNLEMTHSS